MNLRNFSFLATTLCIFSFLFAPAAAPAAEARIIGKLYAKGKVLLNDKSAQSGADVRNGSKIQTFAQPAKVFLIRGGTIYIKAYSRVRVWDFEDEPIRLDIVFGGAEVRSLDNKRPDQWPTGWIGNGNGVPDGATGLEPLPYLAAFGFGNFSFPSIGGGGGGGTGGAGTLAGGTTPASNPPVTQVTP